MGIKRLLRRIAEGIFQSSWYPNKKIILESIPDLSSQTYPVFKYMLDQGLNREYKIIWWVTDKKKFRKCKIKNVVFHNYTPTNLYEQIQKFYDLCTARAMLDATRYIGKIFDRQFFFYLMHGACIKARLKHAREDEVNEHDGSICLSPFLREYDTVQVRIEESRFIITGYPRNDYLFTDDKDFCRKVLKTSFRKWTVIWMPTFRKSKDGSRIDSNFDFPLGLPCLYSLEDCKRLNSKLIEYDATLVIKPHPGQDVSALRDFNLSNIVFIYDGDLETEDVQLYQFLGATDALITDYSSVYYDYLLTKKKIGITIDDIDEYAKTTGFVFDNPLDILIGKYIRNVDDMISFILHVTSEKDDMLEEREKITALVHTYTDSLSTKRVYDLVINEINKRYSK